MAELSVAIIGCEGVGALHLAGWAQQSGARVSAVCDRDGVTAARAAARFEDSSAFTNYRDLLTAGPFDIVDICEPVDAQFEIAKAALQARANVLCEAPFTGSVESATALTELAAARERLLMPAFFLRFEPSLWFLHELIENDDLGRPTMFRCRLSGDYGMPRLAPASGALLNTALHGLDLFRFFCGEVTSVSGRTATIHPDSEAEDTVAIVLNGNATVGVVEASWNPIGAQSALEVYGTAGACLVDLTTGTLRYTTADQPIWQHRDEIGPSRVERMIAHFADVVRGLQTPLVTANDAVRALELCAEVARRNER
jgi:predicted dehydrogenase